MTTPARLQSLIDTWSHEAAVARASLRQDDYAKRCQETVEALRELQQQCWQPIETCPEQRAVLLFAPFTHPEAPGKRDWKMGTGHRYSNSYPLYENEVRWCWEGSTLKTWDPQPTHWMPLPEPPTQERQP